MSSEVLSEVFSETLPAKSEDKLEIEKEEKEEVEKAEKENEAEKEKDKEKVAEEGSSKPGKEGSEEKEKSKFTLSKVQLKTPIKVISEIRSKSKERKKVVWILYILRSNFYLWIIKYFVKTKNVQKWQIF